MLDCNRLRKTDLDGAPSEQRMTLRELAKIVGVSTSTASRALNQSTAISEEVRKRVLRAAQETNYIPNSMARGLALRRSHLIGLVVPSIGNPFFAEIARGAHDAAYERGYVVTLCDTQRSKNREDLFVQTLLQSRVDGVIVTGGVLNQEHIRGLKHHRLPVVLAGRRSSGTGHSGVSVDNVLVGYEASRYLLEKGHRKILYMSGPAESAASRDRQRGFEDAIQGSDLEASVVQGDFSMESGFEEAARIASLKTAPTGVFAANDMMAIGLIMGLINLGLKVPGDIAVVGTDDIPMGALIRPALTTVHVPMYDIGTRSMQLLLRSIEGDDVAPTESILLDCKLIVRESAG